MDVSLDLLGPEKWFTYQDLQDSTRNPAIANNNLKKKTIEVSGNKILVFWCGLI